MQMESINFICRVFLRTLINFTNEKSHKGGERNRIRKVQTTGSKALKFHLKELRLCSLDFKVMKVSI